MELRERVFCFKGRYVKYDRSVTGEKYLAQKSAGHVSNNLLTASHRSALWIYFNRVLLYTFVL